MYIGS
jgi:hypothetical protein